MEILLREVQNFTKKDNDIIYVKQDLLREMIESSVLEGHFVKLASNLPVEEKKIVSAVSSLDLKSNFAYLSSR